MPRNQTNQQKSTPSVSANTMFPRVSYTGPIMPRPTPTPIPMQSSSPSFMQTVKEGFSFGVGASIARNIVDRVFGSSSPPVPSPPTAPSMPVQPVEPKVKIGEDQHLYHKCIQDGGKHETCKDYLV